MYAGVYICSFVRRWLLLAGVIACALGASRPAAGLPAFPAIVDSTYHFKPQGNIRTAGCNLCHSGTTDAKHLNPYGRDVSLTLKQSGAKVLTAALLHSLDIKDSDGDGFTNHEEFVSDTLPGDAASKPAKHPAGMHPDVTALPNSKKASLGEEIRNLVLPPHAQHPVIVHFPIALFIISVFFDLLAMMRKHESLARAGYFNLVVAAVTSVPSIVTGLLAWWFEFGHAPLEGNLLTHLLLAIGITLIMWAMVGIRIRRVRSNAVGLGMFYLVLALAGIAVISLTGHIGGILSGVNQ